MNPDLLGRKLRSFLNTRKKKKRLETKATRQAMHLLKAWVDVRRGADVIGDAERLEAFFFLNDFTSKGFCFFSSVRLEPGEHLAMNLKVSRGVYLKGTVLHCNELPLSEGVSKKEQHRFRVQVRLNFVNSAEAGAVSQLSQHFENRVFGISI